MTEEQAKKEKDERTCIYHADKMPGSSPGTDKRYGVYCSIVVPASEVADRKKDGWVEHPSDLIKKAK